MAVGLKFGVLLETLEKRGEPEKAEKLKRRVAERFKGVLNEEELLNLPVDDIVGTLDLFNHLFTEVKKPSSILEQHISELKKQGFTVVKGAKYHA